MSGRAAMARDLLRVLGLRSSRAGRFALVAAKAAGSARLGPAQGAGGA